MLTRTRVSCKAHSTSIAFAICISIVAIWLSGCAGPQVESQSFRVNKNSAIESSQTAIDANFNQYRQLLATELGIYFPQDQSTTAADINRIREIFRSAFLAELDGYNIVSEPGPTTMAVEASLVDMRNAIGDQIPHMRKEVRDMAQPGTIVFLMELRDSVSNRVLARAADSAKAPTISSEVGVETDWASIEAAATHWADLFRTFLDENFAH